MKDLHTYLFTNSGYNKNVRPASDQTQPTNVTVDLTISALVGFDQLIQKLVTVGFLKLCWTDDFLQWTAAAYGGITYTEVPQGLVWKPDVHLSNGFTDFQELGGSFMQLRVSNNGDVLWYPYKVFETKCKLDITYFPFDKQTCKIQFVVWSSSAEFVRLSLGSGIEFDDLSPHGEWTITNSYSTSFVDEGESFVTFYITLKRKPLLYVLENIFPIIFLSILSIVTFLLPAESGERMSFSITIFLSFAVFLTIVSQQIPENTETVPIFSIYLLIQLSIDVIVIIIAAIQLRYHHREDSNPVPEWAVKVTEWSRRCRNCCCCRHRHTHANGGYKCDVKDTQHDKGNNNESSNQFLSEKDFPGNTDVSWKDVVSATDYFMCIVLTIVLLITTVVVFAILLSHYYES